MFGFAAERLMQLKTEVACGAAPGERTAGRTNQRNGYRERDWETRAGTVELRILLSVLSRASAYGGESSDGRQARQRGQALTSQSFNLLLPFSGQ